MSDRHRTLSERTVATNALAAAGTSQALAVSGSAIGASDLSQRARGSVAGLTLAGQPQWGLQQSQ